tara:strand:- start:500 stop:868 length:369 start_codon:yes stop_codon:yes gene_type:complete
VLTAYKILAQAAVSSDSSFAETLYTCPASPAAGDASRRRSQVLVSSIVVCNKNASSARTYAIKVVPSGEVSADKHILFNDRSLTAKGTEISSMGIGLQPGDKILVHAQTADICISMFGIEMV